MHKVIPKIILMYYEYPQVFIAENLVNQNFCCMVISEEESGPKYLCTAISNTRKQKLLTGTMDLREVFENPELSEFFCSISAQESESFIFLQHSEFKICPEELLPKSGLVFDYDEVASKALELNTTISYASLSVPEAEHELRIQSPTLARFLTCYESVLKNLCKHVVKGMKKKAPTEGSLFGMDVFGYSHSSFTIHFRSSSDGDLFGDNYVQFLALEKLGEFLENTKNPEISFQYIQSVKGHAAASLIRLLEFVHENQSPLRISWATPRTAQAGTGQTNAAGVKSLIELCREREDLSEEVIVIIGVVASASIDSNTWKLNNEGDGQQYRGGVREDSDISMRGIVIELQRYKFHCTEKVEVNPGTGREATKLSLFRIEELDA